MPDLIVTDALHGTGKADAPSYALGRLESMSGVRGDSHHVR